MHRPPFFFCERVRKKLRCSLKRQTSIERFTVNIYLLPFIGFLRLGHEKLTSTVHRSQSSKSIRVSRCQNVCAFRSLSNNSSLETRESRSSDPRSLCRPQSSHTQTLRRRKQRTPLWPCSCCWSRTLPRQNHSSNG